MKRQSSNFQMATMFELHVHKVSRVRLYFLSPLWVTPVQWPINKCRLLADCSSSCQPFWGYRFHLIRSIKRTGKLCPKLSVFINIPLD